MSVEYNNIRMELVNIDRFERAGVSSKDGTNRLWNQYTIQITAIVHYAYLNLGGGPFPTNVMIRNLLMEKRKYFRMSFVTGGSANQSNRVEEASGFGEVGFSADNPFILSGPTAAEIKQIDVVPDSLDPQDAEDEKEIEIMIESPPPGCSVDAHNGPDPLFCHVTEFMGTNGFVVTWAVQTWLTDCPGDNNKLSPLVDNRFVSMHDVDEQQNTTVSVVGTATFRTDLLYFQSAVPDDFRSLIIAPVYKGFRRSQIQVKQTSDTTVMYATSDEQTPVVFDASVDNLVKAEITTRRTLAQKDALDSALIKGLNQYYQFRANQNFAKGEKEKERRLDELFKAELDAHRAKTEFYRSRTKGKNP